MEFTLNMSAGRLFDVIRPAALLVSAVTSIWVLISANKRFPLYQALGWALGTVFFPLIVLPLYLVARVVLTRHQDGPAAARVFPARTSSSLLIPLLYGTLVLASIGLYLFLDHGSVDAHLARATEAKINGEQMKAVWEYEQALALEDNAHTHKLLAAELADLGFWSNAISELRLAERGGEPDDSIYFRLGLLLERINHQGEARLEYQKFLLSSTCERKPMDSLCQSAQQTILSTEQKSK